MFLPPLAGPVPAATAPAPACTHTLISTHTSTLAQHQSYCYLRRAHAISKTPAPDASHWSRPRQRPHHQQSHSHLQIHQPQPPPPTTSHFWPYLLAPFLRARQNCPLRTPMRNFEPQFFDSCIGQGLPVRLLSIGECGGTDFQSYPSHSFPSARCIFLLPLFSESTQTRSRPASICSPSQTTS